MTDEERRRIAEEARQEADLANRIKNLEAKQEKVEATIVWVARSIWGAVAYLALQLWNYIANGGSLGR